MKIFTAVVFLSTLFRFSKPDQEFQVNQGDYANITDYPYLVSVRYYDFHWCGGTIISRRVILTAAHCLYEIDNIRINIRVGSTRHSKGTYYDIDWYEYNSNFSFPSLDYDVGLIRTERPLELGSTVKVATLATERVNSGSYTSIAGWGSYYPKSPSSPKLRSSINVVLTLADCRKVFLGITDRKVCVSNEDDKNVCGGDSGGPLSDPSSGLILGVASSSKCGKKISVYMSVPDLYNWINATYNNFVKDLDVK